MEGITKSQDVIFQLFVGRVLSAGLRNLAALCGLD